MAGPDDIRVEIVLKNAPKLFERIGPDVSEIFSQSSKADIQSRVRKLVRDTQPYCVIVSPPCIPLSPLQEIGRAKRDREVMA